MSYSQGESVGDTKAAMVMLLDGDAALFSYIHISSSRAHIVDIHPYLWSDYQSSDVVWSELSYQVNNWEWH